MVAGEQRRVGEQGRRYWRWSKSDFFPEPSFRSWAAYGGALAATVPRLCDRVMARSSDAVEAGTLLAESENPLHRCLSWVDLAFLGFGSVVSSGVFVLTGQEERFAAGLAILLAYAAAGFSALLSSFCYAELATEIPSAYSVAFAATGVKWAPYIVVLGALKGMTSGLLVGALGQVRYTTQIARTHMIPPYFALVHPKTGTPVYATIAVTLDAACVALFSSLEVLASVSSINTLFIFALDAVALLVHRYYVAGRTSASQLRTFQAFLALIVLSSIGLSVYYNSRYARRWPGYAAFGVGWAAGTAGLALCANRQREPKVYDVPLMSWLPAMSVATNLFLMGSLGTMAYLRFGICTVVMLAYYVLFGVHVTYDVVHSGDGIAAADAAAAENVEQGKIVPRG